METFREWQFKFYNSKRWKECRGAYMASQYWTCERCGAGAYVVHHKEYVTTMSYNNPEVLYNWDNLEALCNPCHEAEHNRLWTLHKRHHKENEFEIDSEGNVTGTSKEEGINKALESLII